MHHKYTVGLKKKMAEGYLYEPTLADYTEEIITAFQEEQVQDDPQLAHRIGNTEW